MSVYISCVDEVRYSFVSHLSESLCEKGINDVFVDTADNLSEEAQAKVERARVSVMVLPGNRKLNTALGCLGKLGEIIRCQRNDDQVVVPVLYGVRKVKVEWLSELKKITGLSHFHQSRKECSDSELVEEIARDVYEKLYHIGRIGIYSKLLQIENMVNKQPLGIRCVGIWGMPGIGKTTLAKAFFDQKSGKFDASCFIEDFDKVIHEKGLYRLLGKQFLKEKPPDGVTTTKLSMLRDKLKNKRVLVVLDDVCNPLAAESFLGGFDWFGPESLIIITSRDKQVFRLCQVDQIYEVQGLNEKESLKLISLYVFRNDKEERNLQELSMKVIKYASGHPLALNIYGRELKGKKKLSEMETALLRLKQRPPVQIFDAFKSSYEKKLSEMETALLRLKPRLPFQIFDAFKSSYDTLNDSEKNIFLDIACFFRGENVDYVMQLLEGCDFFPHVGVDVLVDKGLVTISENILQMHNLIQDVGQEIINGKTIYIERRRRLWEPWSIKYLLEDNEHKRTLKRAQGTEDIEGMFLDTTNISFDIKPAAFDNMLNLRLLKIYCSNPEINHVINFPKGSLHSLPNELRFLHWDNYPLQSLPQKFDPGHLVEINMPYSQLQKLWGGTKNLEMLRTIRLCHSQELVDVNDLSKAQNLEVIDLQGCTRLHSFPDTCQLLHLRVVNLSGCLEINSFPDLPPNIETLHLQGTGIIKLPIVKQNGGELVSLSEFQGLSDDLKLERLKSLQKSSLSCQDLGKLICLDLKDCSLLRSLPNMANLEFLEVFDLSGCSELKTIQSFPRNLKKLYIAGAAVKELPQLPQSLEFMNAHGSRLRSLPNMANLELLKVLDLSGCSRLNTIQSFPRNLKELYLAGTAVKQVPQLPQSLELLNAHGSHLRSLPNMANIAYLKVIDISGCSKLKAIKGLPRNLKDLDIAGTSVRGLPQLPQSLELLNSHGCVSLTSIRLDFEKLPMHYNFSNCFDLSPQVVNNFLVKALNNFKYIPRDHQQELNRALAFSFCAPSHAIQNSTLDLQQGSSVMARLNPSWRNTLVGFAMLVEVAFSEDFYDVNGFGIRCVCRWKNKEGHSHRIERNFHCWAPGKVVPKVQEDHMFVFFDVNIRPSTADGNDPNIWADLIFFEFFPVSKQTEPLYDSCTVTKCGVRVITGTTRDTSLENVLPTLSSDPMEFSSNEVEEVPRVSYDGLQEMDKALFLDIAGLFNDEDVGLVSPLIANIDLDVSSGLKVLAKRSLIGVSSNEEIVMHCLLPKMGKEILYSESMLPGSSKDLARDFEKVSVASSLSRNWKYDVFSSFSGQDVRKTFLNHLHQAFRSNGILVFSDNELNINQVISTVLKQAISDSRILIVVFSENYASSSWNLNQLVEIAKFKKELGQIVIPVFYKVNPSDVRKQKGEFGRRFKKTCMNKTEDEIQQWCQTLTNVAHINGYAIPNGNESELVNDIVKHVQNALEPKAALTEHQTAVSNPKPKEASNGNGAPSTIKSGGQRLTQLEEKLDLDYNENKTRYVGIVGMAGIGKTYLANKLFQKLKRKIGCNVFLKLVREKTTDEDLDLQKRLVEGLLNKTINFSSKNPLEERKNDLIQKKVVFVLDNVSDQKEIELLLGNCSWIKEGSIIVITTRDKSLLKGLNCDIYEVPKMNDRESLELFRDRAQVCSSSNLEENFMELSKKFVDYAGGNPLALKNFGKELYAKEKDHWEKRLGTLTECSNPKVREKLRSSYDELNEQQKDVFLDIAHFFISEDETYVTSLLDSFDPGSAEAGKELIRGLVDKFLISVCYGRVEMHNLLLTMAKEHVGDTAGKYWLWRSNCEEFTSALRNIEGRDKVRGIIVDMSNVKEMPLDHQAFVGMSSLRYLKVCDTGHSDAQCKLNLPDVLEFPKDNIVRYLNWMKFPGEELPSDFEPTNLIDLRLPYSKITSVWKYDKVAPELRWVDLSHSSNLSSLSGLSEAPKLLRLNLEGCTSLKELPEEMQKMKKLVSLNLRGCTSLLSLPKITMDSLKTLILSGCSKFQTFEVISKHLKTLYLNSTAIDELPPAIGNLHGLIFLDLKDCKNLATLPDCLWKLKSLQELELSGCSKLKSFPNVKGTMVNLRILLLDGTSIPEMPSNIFDSSFLRRLCLSRNEEIRSLLFDMSQMFHLEWLELKYCKNLTSLPKLPPNLLCLNAHGCSSLRTVASPLASLMPTEQIHSTFILTNCHKLEQVSKYSIISYIQKKSKLMSNDRHSQALIGTCFPGCDVPVWFNHQALGSVLRLELPRDGNEGRLSGIFLCVVVSFKEYKAQNNSLQVRCTCEFSSISRESFIVGGWSEPNEELHTVVSDHVFIGYSTLFNSKQRKQFSSATEVSLRFEVTNGTREVAECKVMKCGISLVFGNKRLPKTFNFPWNKAQHSNKGSHFH